MINEEILSGCLKNNPKAQAKFYKHYASKVMGTCLRYTNSRAEAEDVFQDAFVKIFKSLEKLSEIHNLDGWIKRITINTALNHYHKHKKHTGHDDVTNSYFLQDENPSILASLGAEELLKLVNLLPDGYRMVFNLYAIEGYPHKEIAEMLGINEGTSKSQLFKARAMLKQLIASKLQVNFG